MQLSDEESKDGYNRISIEETEEITSDRVKNWKEEFRCPICKCLLCHPKTCGKCQSLFCSKCIYQFICREPQCQKCLCPKCKDIWSLGETPEILKQMIAALQIKCNFCLERFDEEVIRVHTITCKERMESKTELPIRKGWLLKERPTFYGGWQKRFFVLAERQLIYYAEENKLDSIKGNINFDQVNAVVEYKSDCQLMYIYIYIYIRRIKESGSERTFVLKADSEYNAIEWVTSIQKHIDVSEGKSQNKSLSLRMKTKFKVYRLYMYIERS